MAIGFQHLVPVLFILLSVASFWSATSDSTSAIIEYLPGFEGPLPFKLETGYTEVGEDNDAQLFYYFVESQGNPKADPIILWLAGGPRCSTFTGFIYEIGPLAFKDGYRETHMEGAVGGIRQVVSDGDVPGLQLNPYAWTQIASIIFVDQPVGSGFSYSKAGREGEMTDTKSALDTYKFLLKWLEDHPQYRSNPLYVCGDSYSGITVPQVVQEIIRGIEAGKGPVLNFQGYTLGNPVTDREFETNSEVPFSHRMGLISDELYESLDKNCKGSYVNFDSSNLLCASYYKRFTKIVSGVNPYSILEPLCSAASKQNDSSNTRPTLESIRLRASNCRDDGYKLSEIWANDDRVQTALRVRKGTITIKTWVRCNSYGNPDQVDHGVKYVMDVKSSLAYHRNISTKGYRSLIYSGDHDMRISHVSTEAWIRSLNISVVDEWRPWLVEGQVAGFTTRYANGMIYATLKGAGHITPEYQPKESYTLFKNWLLDDAL
ncbi:sinapoylglucose--choline O-sinapoyltransferase [Ranunculus cassubicifolius]